MNRALRAVLVGVLLCTPVALSACSAGQVAQTASQDRNKAGGSAEAGDILLRGARLAYPSGGEYAVGSDARLIVAIANGGPTDDTLVSISGSSFQGVEVTGTSAAATSAAPGATNSTVDIPVPGHQNVYIGGDGPTVTLTGLPRTLAVGDSVQVTMTFAQAGDIPVTVLVGDPTRDLPRGSAFNFKDQSKGADAGVGG